MSLDQNNIILKNILHRELIREVNQRRHMKKYSKEKLHEDYNRIIQLIEIADNSRYDCERKFDFNYLKNECEKIDRVVFVKYSDMIFNKLVYFYNKHIDDFPDEDLRFDYKIMEVLSSFYTLKEITEIEITDPNNFEVTVWLIEYSDDEMIKIFLNNCEHVYSPNIMNVLLCESIDRLDISIFRLITTKIINPTYQDMEICIQIPFIKVLSMYSDFFKRGYSEDDSERTILLEMIITLKEFYLCSMYYEITLSEDKIEKIIKDFPELRSILKIPNKNLDFEFLQDGIVKNNHLKEYITPDLVCPVCQENIDTFNKKDLKVLTCGHIYCSEKCLNLMKKCHCK